MARSNKHTPLSINARAAQQTRLWLKELTVKFRCCRSVLLDVRLQRNFADGAMANSVNVPLYQPISGWSLPANIRRAGFAFFGIYGTERNPGWLAQVEALLRKGAHTRPHVDVHPRPHY